MECTAYRFSVVASNGAGMSDPSVFMETVPLCKCVYVCVRIYECSCYTCTSSIASFTRFCYSGRGYASLSHGHGDVGFV